MQVLHAHGNQAAGMDVTSKSRHNRLSLDRSHVAFRGQEVVGGSNTGGLRYSRSCHD